MRGKTVVITGATSGIGEVAAVQLAEQGARIVFTARDKERAQTTLEKLRRVNPASGHVVHLADLSLLAETRRAAEEIKEEPAIDVLINNAGALFNNRIETADGLEKTFALNHMSYFVFTNLLLPRLKAGARIVNTASDAHHRAKLDFSDLQSRKGYSGFAVYSKSKLCNILFTRELARRIAGTGITANSLHPGFVATRFGDQSGGVLSALVRVAKPIGAISPAEGAKTIIYLASSPEVARTSGEYFTKCAPASPSAEARSDQDARKLWDVSAEIAGDALVRS
ncbi:MAG TPA: SDR family oxidoreductase [Rhizomicrobium sp.]|nr:SDR family oxidoreductase [Rhizomicrobium sp.]